MVGEVYRKGTNLLYGRILGGRKGEYLMEGAKIIKDIEQVLATLDSDATEVYFTITPTVAQYHKQELAKEYEIDYDTKVDQPARRLRMELDRRIYIAETQKFPIIQWTSKPELDEYLKNHSAA